MGSPALRPFFCPAIEDALGSFFAQTFIFGHLSDRFPSRALVHMPLITNCVAQAWLSPINPFNKGVATPTALETPRRISQPTPPPHDG
jgi:hypothetical protein